MGKTCIVCGKRAYSDYCVSHKPRKRITQRGKEYERYEKFKHEVAIPYLDRTFGHKCRNCGATENLDRPHKQTLNSSTVEVSTKQLTVSLS